MRLSYINYLEAGKRRSSISGFSFYLEHSYFALFCVVHSQIAQDGSIWRGLYFAENPIFFLVLILLSFSSAILRCLIFFLRNRPFFFTHR